MSFFGTYQGRVHERDGLPPPMSGMDKLDLELYGFMERRDEPCGDHFAVWWVPTMEGWRRIVDWQTQPPVP